MSQVLRVMLALTHENPSKSQVLRVMPALTYENPSMSQMLRAMPRARALWFVLLVAWLLLVLVTLPSLFVLLVACIVEIVFACYMTRDFWCPAFVF